MDGTILQYIGKMNPMYWYITTFRGCVADGVYPSIGAVAICRAFAIVSLLIGGTVFKKHRMILFFIFKEAQVYGTYGECKKCEYAL